MEDETKVAWPLRVIVVVTAVWLVAPTLVVIPLSFSNKKSFRFPPDGWSLRFYESLFTDPTWRQSLLSSLQVALTVTALATTLGTLGAIALAHGRLPLSGAINAIVMSPMIIPGIIFAVGAFNIFLSWHLVGSFTGFILAHTALALPFPFVTVGAGLRALDPDVERAAAVLGADPWAKFGRVTFPLLLPSVLSGAAFAFMTSFDEVVVSLFIQSPEFRTLPVKMWTSVRTETDPTIAAAATAVIVLSTAILLLSQFRPRRRPGA